MNLLRKKTGQPHQRLRDSYLRYTIEELKFLKSVGDLKAFYQKVAYVVPRKFCSWLLQTGSRAGYAAG